MKRISIVFLFLFVLNNSYGQDTIYSFAWDPSSNRIFDLNDRDTTNRYIYIDSTQTSNVWELGTPSKVIFNSAYTLPLALMTDTINTYPNNNISSFSFIVWTDCNWSEVFFKHRINTDSLKDGGTIEYTIDGGITWNNIINSTYTLTDFYSSSDTIDSNSNNPGFSGTSTAWRFSRFWGPTISNIIEYRFTFTSDSINTNKEGWIIDDIFILNASVGINEYGTNSQIHIFPNPTSNFISIQTDNSIQYKSAEIKDVLGKTILSSNQSIIDLSKFETGVYFVEVTTDKGRSVKRIVKN